jgi:hypothetical protein
VCVIVLLAACGGASPSARPTSTDPTERLLLTLEWFEDRACACTDRACAEALDDVITETLKDVEVPRLFEDQAAAERADRAMQRSVACMWSQGFVAFGYEKVAMKTAQEYRRKACSCATSGCSVAMEGAERRRALYLLAVPLDKERLKEANTTIEEAVACPGHHAAATAAADVAIAELSAIRDRACACRDADCVEATRADLGVWLERNALVAGSKEQEEQLLVIAKEAGNCFASAEKVQP